MEFGMFHEFLRAPGQTEAEAFDRAFEIVDAAEEHGLDAMWIAELHVAQSRELTWESVLLQMQGDGQWFAC